MEGKSERRRDLLKLTWVLEIPAGFKARVLPLPMQELKGKGTRAGQHQGGTSGAWFGRSMGADGRMEGCV